MGGGFNGVDKVLCGSFVAFAITSLIFEPYITFLVPLEKCQLPDVVGVIWHWYAKSFDPIFLSTPMWLRVMCTIDFVLFGPAYLVLLYAFRRFYIDGKPPQWLRSFGYVFVSAIVYSTLVYFAVELLEEVPLHGADAAMVIAINIPYTILPLMLAWRLRNPVFEPKPNSKQH